MSDALNLVYGTIDEQNSEKSAATRRQLVAGAGAALGGMGLLGLADNADAATAKAAEHSENIQTILNVAATAEVLATIVNTIGGEQDISFFRGLPGDPSGEITRQNVRAAAVEELDHFNVLTTALGAKPVTRTIYVPNAYLANATNFLSALEIGDEIFVNAYLLATTVFGNQTSIRAGTRGRFARIAAEFCGVEAIHRAAARQSLGKLGNDRVFLRYSQGEESNSPKPDPHQVGFRRVTSAVTQLQAAGFGFGAPGSLPGTAFSFDQVSQRTPQPNAVGGPLAGVPNTRLPR
jgi:hypothetical protein